MKHTRAARAYAKALLHAAKQEQSAPQLRQPLENLQRTLESSEPLRNFLANPMIAPSAKQEALRRLVDEEAPPIALAFLTLLIERKRERELEAVLEETLRQLDEAEGVERAEVVSAAPLTERQQAALSDALTKAVGRRTILNLARDPSLIAGFTARVGDTVYDGSLRTQLERIRKILSQPSSG